MSGVGSDIQTEWCKGSRIPSACEDRRERNGEADWVGSRVKEKGSETDLRGDRRKERRSVKTIGRGINQATK
ncbi:hypothetical protein chiPu_0033335 [Chiloscyllium punctatum]|uniref:Uncharacterized protein n=1 Tax=Chiloscyllium punctatum TaxID=137246 RepID=A0A401U2T9_CHIPU|nr:hypothetical protein [Chiloscyllium punctatum]